MTPKPLRTALAIVTLLLWCSAANASAFIQALSSITPGFGDPVYGNAGMESSLTRRYYYVPTSGANDGYDYSATVHAAATTTQFNLFASSGGRTDPGAGNADIPGAGLFATAAVYFHDELLVPGTGRGMLVVPWHITGGFSVSATDVPTANPRRLPYARFGIPFCQAIATGSPTGGLGCFGGGSEDFTQSVAYDRTLDLAFPVQFGVLTDLNTRFVLNVGSGGGLTRLAEGDFSHTGLLQPVRVYDNAGNLLTGVVIIASSGVNYANPQAGSVTGVPEPDNLLPLFIIVSTAAVWRRLSRPRSCGRNGRARS